MCGREGGGGSKIKQAGLSEGSEGGGGGVG